MEHIGFVRDNDARKDSYIAARKREASQTASVLVYYHFPRALQLKKKFFMFDSSASVLQPFMENSFRRRSCPLSSYIVTLNMSWTRAGWCIDTVDRGKLQLCCCNLLHVVASLLDSLECAPPKVSKHFCVVLVREKSETTCANKVALGFVEGVDVYRITIHYVQCCRSHADQNMSPIWCIWCVWLIKCLCTSTSAEVKKKTFN